MTQIPKPEPGTYPEYFNNYISKINGENLLEQMLTVHYDTIDLITSVDLETQFHTYAPGKWKNTNYENYDPSTGIPVKSDCIVVKDKLMRQYRFPFPNYVQTWGSLPGMKKAVDNLNNRFKTAFEKGFDINAAF
jgi:hypothetical protein